MNSLFITFLHSILFIIPLSFTPGPNNLLAIALGKQNGYKKNIPFILGVWIGILIIYTFLLLLGQGIFNLVPGIQLYIIIVGSCYMLYLSWKTILAGTQQFKERKIKKFKVGFWEAASLQWVNPKGIVTQITVIALFKQPSLTVNLILFTALSAFIMVSVSFWTIFGKIISPILQKSKKGNFLFHLLLGSILAALSIYFILDSATKLRHLYF